MTSEEFSIDLSEESVKQLEEALGLKELEEIHKRFKNGTETLDDLLHHCYRYNFKFEIDGNEEELDLVEWKYYKKLIDLIEKQNKELEKKDAIINLMAEFMAGGNYYSCTPGGKEMIIKEYIEKVEDK